MASCDEDGTDEAEASESTVCVHGAGVFLAATGFDVEPRFGLVGVIFTIGAAGETDDGAVGEDHVEKPVGGMAVEAVVQSLPLRGV